MLFLMTYQDPIVHRGIAISGSGGGGGSRGRSVSTSSGRLVEVVSHLRVQLFGGLLGRSRAAPLALPDGTARTTTSGTGGTGPNGDAGLLVGGGRLGMRLRLAALWG